MILEVLGLAILLWNFQLINSYLLEEHLYRMEKNIALENIDQKDVLGYEPSGK